MGPPINSWPSSHHHDHSLVLTLVDKLSGLGVNCTVVVVLVQIFLSLNYVTAGPVILNLDYLQGPVPLARNIRHLPCVSRRTGEEGLCMFAIDCLKANGSHLGTCIDRFYFGSCCQIPDKNILPSIINNVDDNTIDSSSFVHPHTEDKLHSTVNKIPDVFTKVKPVSTTKSPLDVQNVTEAQTTASVAQERTEPNEVDKVDSNTTLDNTIHDDDITTQPVTSSSIKVTEVSKTTERIEPTEVPIKLSTFQTVSGDSSNLIKEHETTVKPIKIETTEAVTTTEKPKPTRKPIKPTYKPRPTYRPTNFTRPHYTGTGRPRPTKPVTSYNTTRKPPFRIPSKRPPTKKPLPIPPRLNITIIPQSTSSKPAFTRPSVPIITYINTTVAKVEEKTTTPTTTISTTTTTTIAPITTERDEVSETITETVAEQQTESIPKATEAVTTEYVKITEPIPETTQSSPKSTESPPESTQATSKLTEAPTKPTEAPTKSTTTPKIITTETTPKPTEKLTTEAIVPTTESVRDTTLLETTIVFETEKPTEAEITTTSTEFPPFMTWSNTFDTVTKTPETTSTTTTTTTTTTAAPKTTTDDELWSPITPPDGWVLLSTPPKEDSTTKSSTTTSTTTTESTLTEAPVTVLTQSYTSQAQSETTQSVTTQSVTTQSVTTQSVATPVTTVSTPATELLEFTVNVTLSPTVPPTTESVVAANVTLNETTTSEGQSSNTTESTTTVTTTTEATFNTSNYKDMCGRRMWPQGRIVGGAKSGFGQWPWQISLRQYRTSTYLHKCGAALLNENWAITAAHCVEHVPPSELLVRLGEHDLANEEEPYGFAERRVQIIASHPHFDPATFEYDLALLRFYEPVTFQPNIIPVCVPDNDDDYVGKTAYVTGWGRLYDEGPLPSVLQEVEVPVINNTACEAMYQAAGYNEHIPNIFICAGWKKGGADSCEGDSGGPMVIQRDRDDRFVLGGVISWGIGCAEPNQPGVYTRISEFRDWINQILQF
ncbi:unnamed protein product [Colias eurytheme]|nr:unnamed protein product [Colias eurytheme]